MARLSVALLMLISYRRSSPACQTLKAHRLRCRTFTVCCKCSRSRRHSQSATDRAELAKLLNISDNQLGYVTNVPAGCGLIRCAGNIVPFTNSFPKNTKLYGLMTTKPDEVRKE